MVWKAPRLGIVAVRLSVDKVKNHHMVTVARHEIDILYIFIMYIANILMFIHSVAMESKSLNQNSARNIMCA